MTDRPSASAAHHAWLDAMFADLQRQIDDLAGRLDTLTRLAHLHTLAPLDGGPEGQQRPSAHDVLEGCDDPL